MTTYINSNEAETLIKQYFANQGIETQVKLIEKGASVDPSTLKVANPNQVCGDEKTSREFWNFIAARFTRSEKVKFIRLVRMTTNIGLVDAKEFAETFQEFR